MFPKLKVAPTLGFVTILLRFVSVPHRRNANGTGTLVPSNDCLTKTERNLFIDAYCTIRPFTSLVPRPEEVEEEKGPGFSRFAHALIAVEFHHIIETRPTTRGVITILQCFFHTHRQMQNTRIIVSCMASSG